MEGDQPVEVGPPSEVVAAENGGFREEVEDEYGVDAPLGNDIHAGGLDDSATLLTIENGFATAASNIDRDADSDVFRFVATQSQTYLDAFGELPIVLTMYDADGNSIGEAQPHFEEPIEPGTLPPDPQSAGLTAETTPGETYYVSVGSTKGRVGPYSLYVNSPEPPEPLVADAPLGQDVHGDSVANATALSFGAEPHVEVISNIDSEGEADFFKISVPKGMLTGEAFNLDGQVQLELYAADGSLVPVEDGLHGVVIEHVEAGDYFLKVSGDTGAYLLSVSSHEGATPSHPSMPAISLPEPGIDPNENEPIDPNPTTDLPVIDDSENVAEEIGDPASVPGTNSDLNGDGAVDMEDFFVLEENFGKEADAAFAEGDISGDGAIDFGDFLLFAYEFSSLA